MCTHTYMYMRIHACTPLHTQQFLLDVVDARLLIRYRAVWVLRAACEHAFHVVTGCKCPACMCAAHARLPHAHTHVSCMHACKHRMRDVNRCGPAQDGEGAALTAAKTGPRQVPEQIIVHKTLDTGLTPNRCMADGCCTHWRVGGKRIKRDPGE